MQNRSEELIAPEAVKYISQKLWPHSIHTLSTYRSLGKGPKFKKRGHRVFYSRDELDSYIESRLRDKFSPE